MAKLVVLKLGDGDLGSGFPVTLQIGEDGERPSLETTGNLPPAVELQENYNSWKSAYYKLGLPYRLEAVAPRANKNSGSFIKDCSTGAQALCDTMKAWLQSESFLPVREAILENIQKNDEVRVLLQTKDVLLQQLPWQLCNLFARYPKAQVALSAPAYECPPPSPPKAKVRILAILGDSTGINTEADKALLQLLPDAEVHFLVEPERQELTEYLWDRQGWDILFFAGHSSTQANGKTGVLQINQNDDLSIEQLKNALQKAVERGLKLALFNSCDGSGLARNLADLCIPQIIVMREPVPDKVAQEFLKYFLEAFARGETLYLAVKEAKEKLQGLEDKFPCASWLPAIYQNPAGVPPTWRQLYKYPDVEFKVSNSRRSFRALVIGSMAALALVMGIRQLGFLQYWELKAFDQLMQLRPKTEGPDPRLLIITNTEADIKAQNDGRGSLSNGTLNQLLDKLEQYQPALIGLDIYRWMPVEPQHKALLKHYQQNHRFVTICKAGDKETPEGIAPPPAIPKEQRWERVGFNDTLKDDDGTIRRHLLTQGVPKNSACNSSWSLNLLLADRYLKQKHSNVPIKINDEDLNVKLGDYTHNILGNKVGGYRQLDARGFQLLLNYRSTNSIAPKITLSDALNGKFTPNLVKDKIILIGTTAPSFNDFHLTPYSNNIYQQMSGVEIQAHMLSQLLSNALDKRPLLWYLPDWAEILWVGIWAFIGGVIIQSYRAKLIIFLASGVAILILYGCCFLLLLQGVWMPLVPSAFVLFAGGVAVFVYTNLFVKSSKYLTSNSQNYELFT